jgi:hypothetical protein
LDLLALRFWTFLVMKRPIKATPTKSDWLANSVSSSIFGGEDVEARGPYRKLTNEDNAEDDNDTSFPGGPVLALGEHVHGSIPDSESVNGSHCDCCVVVRRN